MIDDINNTLDSRIETVLSAREVAEAPIVYICTNCNRECHIEAVQCAYCGEQL